MRAYYTALLQRNHEMGEKIKKEAESPNNVITNGVFNAPSERQVGMKSKREDDFEGDDEWMEGPSAGKNNKTIYILSLIRHFCVVTLIEKNVMYFEKL